MNKNTPRDLRKLERFIIEAGRNGWAAGAEEVPNPKRTGFNELVFFDKDFSYRDSYAGHYISRGAIVVRFQEEPVWSCMYGGGIVKGQEELTPHCFQFLKKALSAIDKDPKFLSFRGPKQFQYGDWRYSYEQEGQLEEFSGYEEIYYRGKLIHYYRVIGGIIV